MAKKIEIDPDEWCTPKQLAQEWNVSKQVINNWVRRGKVERIRIEQLDLTLVRIIHEKFNKKEE